MNAALNISLGPQVLNHSLAKNDAYWKAEVIIDFFAGSSAIKASNISRHS